MYSFQKKKIIFGEFTLFSAKVEFISSKHTKKSLSNLERVRTAFLYDHTKIISFFFSFFCFFFLNIFKAKSFNFKKASVWHD